MGNSAPLISIIITTFKRSERLKKAIVSALEQTYDNKEILVIDDNPPNSHHRKSVEEIMEKFPTVNYIRNSENVGGALARNIGIDNAKGEFIAFLDDDDTFINIKVEEQYKYYLKKKNKNVGLIYCYSSEINDKGQNIGSFQEDYEGKPIYKQMLGCIAGTSLWFCPREVLIDVGKFDDSPNKQDSILLLKILAKGYEVFRVPQILVNYTEHNDSRISGLKPVNVIGINKYRNLCRKNYQFVTDEQIKNVEYGFSKQLIPLYLIANNKKNALKELIIMIKSFPLKKTTIVSIIKCLFPSLYLKRLKSKAV